MTNARMYVPSDECRRLARESYEQGQRDALESLIEAFDTLGMTAAAGATRQALTQLPRFEDREQP